MRPDGRGMSEEADPVNQSSALKYVGIGSLAAVGIFLVVFIAGGIFVANNWRSWVAGPTRDVMTQVMDDADLPDEQKAAILDQTNDFIDAFERGDVTMQELGRFAEAFAQSPVVPMLGVYGIGQAYISQSELSEEEKTDANYRLRRAASPNERYLRTNSTTSWNRSSPDPARIRDRRSMAAASTPRSPDRTMSMTTSCVSSSSMSRPQSTKPARPTRNTGSVTRPKSRGSSRQRWGMNSTSSIDCRRIDSLGLAT